MIDVTARIKALDPRSKSDWDVNTTTPDWENALDEALTLAASLEVERDAAVKLVYEKAQAMATAVEMLS